jgi:hypothetical protein
MRGLHQGSLAGVRASQMTFGSAHSVCSGVAQGLLSRALEIQHITGLPGAYSTIELGQGCRSPGQSDLPDVLGDGCEPTVIS